MLRAVPGLGQATQAPLFGGTGCGVTVQLPNFRRRRDRGEARVVTNIGREATDFHCAVVIPACRCMCAQVNAISAQLGPRDCLVVVRNGPRPEQHDCTANLMTKCAGAWVEFPKLCWATRCLSMVATFGVRMLELRGVVGRPPPSAGAWVESV